jgi:hypothetical protein
LGWRSVYLCSMSMVSPNHIRDNCFVIFLFVIEQKSLRISADVSVAS